LQKKQSHPNSNFSGIGQQVGMCLRKVGPAVAAVGLGIALCLLALAPLGSRLGWWHFMSGLYLFIPASGVTAALAVIIGFATLALCRSQLRPSTLALLSLTIVVGATLLAVPLRFAYARYTLPAIHDVSSDTDHRPEFHAVLAARALEEADRVDTGEPWLSELQKTAYPDIGPVYTVRPVRQAFEAALAVARSMPGWIIVAASPDEGRIEASQRSRWFGFTDDMVVRISPRDGGSRVDMRSASRKGTRDYGVNAARVRAYTNALRNYLG
jgi:uncharacterized protein (DUF1499 family)